VIADVFRKEGIEVEACCIRISVQQFSVFECCFVGGGGVSLGAGQGGGAYAAVVAVTGDVGGGETQSIVDVVDSALPRDAAPVPLVLELLGDLRLVGQEMQGVATAAGFPAVGVIEAELAVLCGI
jgi:hypothetical protein